MEAMQNTRPDSERQGLIRALFEEYIEMYAGRDDRLCEHFSDNFSGYTGGGDFLVIDRQAWLNITRQDFAQVPKRIRIEMLDLALQDISANVVVATAFFHIHLPIPDHVLSKEVARLVLIFRLEGTQWKIVHSGISIPYNLVQDGEVYPLKSLIERNTALEAQVQERTQALLRSEALYRSLTEDTLDVVWKTDRNLVITYISPADERLRGFSAAEVVGRHVFEMFTDDGVACVKRIMKMNNKAGTDGNLSQFLTFEVQHRCKDGRLLWGEVLSRPEVNSNGDIVGYHGITRESTERKRLQEEVHQLAFYDPLTKLANRRLLDDRLGQALVAGKRSSCFGALMLLDLDNFKSLNDSQGHAAGDLLLVEVAKRLCASVRQADTVSRFGGDEFVLLIAELSTDLGQSRLQAETLAEKIRLSLCQPYMLTVPQVGVPDKVVEHHCSASIGVVVFDGTVMQKGAVLQAADSAMYKAKGAGRNTVCIEANTG
jgi:diguanylate cyclase (GGDEF)-like protein/PAS domain S-box-containing protein